MFAIAFTISFYYRIVIAFRSVRFALELILCPVCPAQGKHVNLRGLFTMRYKYLEIARLKKPITFYNKY